MSSPTAARTYTIDELALDPWPRTRELYAYLGDVVHLLQTAVTTGMKHVTDDPDTTSKAIEDCKEVIDVIMAGDVREWIA